MYTVTAKVISISITPRSVLATLCGQFALTVPPLLRFLQVTTNLFPITITLFWECGSFHLV